MIQQKWLILDIETRPMKVFIWELGKQYIRADQIDEDWGVMAWSAKWLLDPASKVIYRDTHHATEKSILKDMWELLNEADTVITQNGQKFDEPRLKAKMMEYGFKPYKPVKHFDTYVQNSDKEFTSHSLDYLTNKFCKKYRKLKHTKFPGLSLWKECLKGNEEAWKEMKRYNIHDVLSTEELYLNTYAWAKKNAPSPNIPRSIVPKCKYCGGFRMRSIGLRKNYRRYLCWGCGKAQQIELDIAEAA